MTSFRNIALAYSWGSPGVVARAIDRLENDDVAPTQFGLRVTLRPDLGDKRGEAKAYWPENRSGCLCYYMKAYGECSHDIAVKIYRKKEEIEYAAVARQIADRRRNQKLLNLEHDGQGRLF